MFNKLFNRQAKKLSSLYAPRVNKDGSYYCIDPIIFDADKTMRAASELALLCDISNYVDNNDDETKEGMNVFLETFSRR